MELYSALKLKQSGQRAYNTEEKALAIDVPLFSKKSHRSFYSHFFIGYLGNSIS
jgi:hypothetical protein